MKCIMMSYGSHQVKRVDDATAANLVRSGDAIYTSKATWKLRVRDVNRLEQRTQSGNAKLGNGNNDGTAS